MKKIVFFVGLLSVSVSMADQNTARFESTWESLKETAAMPEWLQDAKLGYYFHWGPQTFANEDMPFNGGFYPGRMYNPENPVFEYHKKTFGDQATFGWKDLVQQWDPEAFDAQEWADLFARGGARYAGCLAMHVDNTALWDSRLTEWNLKNFGPKQDVLGQLQAAFRSHDMPMVATFHHGVNWTLAFGNAHAYDAADGKNLDLYNEPHQKTDPPTERFLNKWAALVQEVVENYSPDGIYFDYGLKQVADDARRRTVMAHFYNHCADAGVDGIFVHKHRDIIPGGILDTERGRPPYLWPEPFMNDKSIARRCWFNKKCVIEQDGLYTSSELLCALVDLVSKRGVLMLSVAPDKHGRIPANQRELILEIGAWMERNGESVYETRAWDVFGEGPFLASHQGWHKPQWDGEYSAQDVRYTRSKDGKVLYATLMARPDAGPFSLERVRFEKNTEPSVRLLGHGPIDFALDTEGRITFGLPELDEKQFAPHHPLALVIKGMTFRAATPSVVAEPVREKSPALTYTVKGEDLEVRVLREPKGKELVLLDFFLTPSDDARLTCNGEAIPFELNDKGQAVIPTMELGKWNARKKIVLRLSGFKAQAHYDKQ